MHVEAELAVINVRVFTFFIYFIDNFIVQIKQFYWWNCERDLFFGN